MNMALPSSRSKGPWHLLLEVNYMAYSSTMKMEAVYPSETSVKFYQTTRCYIQEDSTLLCEDNQCPAYNFNGEKHCHLSQLAWCVCIIFKIQSCHSSPEHQVSWKSVQLQAGRQTGRHGETSMHIFATRHCECTKKAILCSELLVSHPVFWMQNKIKHVKHMVITIQYLWLLIWDK
jgi:hypothetical protein